MKITCHRLLIIVAIVATIDGGHARANFLTPTRWQRNAASTTYNAWDVFNYAGGPNAPDVANSNPNSGAANTFDTSGTSFISSGGNIYSFSGATSIRTIVPEYGLGAGFYTTVMFQIQTLGTEPDYPAVKLTYHDANNVIHNVTPAVRQELYREELGGFGGALVQTAFEFRVPYSPIDITMHVPASGSSMSFDMASVDTITTLAGDANSNNRVEISDLLALCLNYLKTVQDYTQGDFNGDGFVNISDARILAANWGKNVAGTQLSPMLTGYVPTPVPEPAAAALSVATLLTVIGARKGRRSEPTR